MPLSPPRHGIEVDEAHTVLSFINIGVDFKQKNLGQQGDMMEALKKQGGKRIS